MISTFIRPPSRFGAAYLLLAWGLLVAAPVSFAQANRAVSAATFNIGLPNNSTSGWAFTVNQALVVNALGVADFFNGPTLPTPPPGDGLGVSHHVTLYTAAGAVVADATVPAGTAATLIGESRYVNITPVTLLPGSYVIGAAYSVADPIGAPASFSSDPSLTVTGGRFGAGGDVFPTSTTGGSPNLGPNMLITVPEPGAMSLLALATGALTLRPRGRRM